MSPAEFCPFAVPSPQFHFDGCPLFADGEPQAWTLATLKERLLEIGAWYIQFNYEMQVGPWYEQRQAFGAREANLSQFIKKFHAVEDADRFRTAVRVKYRADLTAKLVDEVVTDLAFASHGELTIAAAETLTLGAAATRLTAPPAPAVPSANAWLSTGGPPAGDPLSWDTLTARATAAYAPSRGGFQLVACSVKDGVSDPAAGSASGLPAQFVNPDDPNCWQIVGGSAHLPFSSFHYLGSTAVSGVGMQHLILGAPGSGFDEVPAFVEFAKNAGAFVRANPPPGFSGGGSMSAEKLWSLLLLFWGPCAAETVAHVGDCRVIDQPWGASLVALRALNNARGSPAPAATTGSGVQAKQNSDRLARKGKRINERMLATLQTKPESVSWSADTWAEHLQCAKSTVVQSNAWKVTIRAARALERADREMRLRGKGGRQRSP